MRIHADPDPQPWSGVTGQIYLDEVSPARNCCQSLPVLELLKDSPQDRERGRITAPAAVEALNIKIHF